MFSSKRILRIAIPLLLLLAAFVIASCGSTKPDGPTPLAQKPVVKIVNIPTPGSHFTTSPLINWFGTDADGFIISYEYAVIPASVVAAAVADTSNAALVMAYAEANIEAPGANAQCTPACWTIVDVSQSDSPTRQQVNLIAGDNPADTIVQFFFVRAVDNDSIRSEVDYSVYSRSNNPPNTEIVTVADRGGYFDLPRLTDTYSGIPFEWKGTDKIDFPSDTDQPKFDFYFQVFGPYAKSELELDSLDRLAAGYQIDTTDVSKLVLTSRDTTLGGVWVPSTSALVHNLWANSPVTDTTRDNYFVLKVTARDDAKTPDPTPAYLSFRAIFPKFEKDVLIYAGRLCSVSPTSGNVPCTPDNPWYGSYDITDLQEYYRHIVAEAGYPNATFTQVEPDKITAAKHRLVIMFGDGDNTYMSDGAFTKLTEYMRLGGNVWAWAPSPFGKLAASTTEGLYSFGPSTLPYQYFRVIGEFHAAWTRSYLLRANTDPEAAVIPVSNEQFLGGLALTGTGLSDFSVDLEKVQGTYIYDRQAAPTSMRSVQFRAAPHTSYFVRDLLSQPLFLYASVFNNNIPDSVKTWIQPIQGAVIAVRADNGLFKSAVFGFSAWAMNETDAIDVTTKMLHWFLD